MAAETTASGVCEYLGWSAGETTCGCGRRFESVQDFERHIGAPGASAEPTDPRVDQTLFLNTPGRQGNCLSACVASYLSIELEDVPHFAEYLPDEGSAWWHLYIGFMAGHGLWPTELDDPTDAEHGEITFVCGPSERGALHQVLYRDGQLWHDPHPSRAGLLGVTEVIAWRPQRHDHNAWPVPAAAEVPTESVFGAPGARVDLIELLLKQAREGDASAGEATRLRHLLERTQKERDWLIAARQDATHRYRRSLNDTLNMFIAAELEAGNTERAASLRNLRAWNRGAGYPLPGARP